MTTPDAKNPIDAMKGTFPPDRFICDVNVLRIEESNALLERMTAEFLAFLAAGGALTWDDWAVMSPISRDAATAARGRLREIDAAVFAARSAPASVAVDMDFAPAGPSPLAQIVGETAQEIGRGRA